ncbi:porin, partial [Rhizobium ruizarguesonis]
EPLNRSLGVEVVDDLVINLQTILPGIAETVEVFRNFRAGLFYSWWDDGLSGETDDIGSVVTLHNSIRYQYETSDFYAGISVDELEDGVY